MPNDRFRGTTQDWLNRARSDLALAKGPLPAGAVYEDLCYHAQQAAEKCAKAIFVERRWEFPYTHDFADLLNRLGRHDVSVPQAIHAAGELTAYAAATRYSGGEPVTEAEWREAVAIAEEVVRWAEGIVREGA